ncbi:MAG: hypothetical protein U5K54_26935 [Cytophagales bacterium]|nr:hypothetical protein [Cytophagales bacterium]
MKTQNITNSQNTWRGKFHFLFIGLSLMFMVSCNNEETTPDFSAEDIADANQDVLEDSYFDDGDDLLTEAFTSTDEDLSGGRVNTDERLICATLTRTGSKSEGSLRVDFGDGCTGPRGNVRSGAIVVTHTGDWRAAGSKWILRYENYSVNGVQLEGERTVTIVSTSDTLVVADVTLVDGKITWPDGRVARREVNRRREHERHPENHLLDRIIIYGTSNGVLPNGTVITIEILERLIYRRACAQEGVVIPVSGVKFIKAGDREITVDYGDGTCDNIVTLTNKNGKDSKI